MNSSLLPNKHYPPGNQQSKITKCLQKIFGFSIPVLIASILLLLLIIPLQNIQAQCIVTPDPAAQTAPIDIVLPTPFTTIDLNQAILNANGIAASSTGSVNGCRLRLKVGNTLYNLPTTFTCGTPAVAGQPFAPGIYEIVSDRGNTNIDPNTSDAIMINVSINDTGDPTITAGCTAPGGPYSTNEDGLNKGDCLTTIPGLTHPTTMDNCSGEVLSVVYTNPDNSMTTENNLTAGGSNTYEFSEGTTTVTYTVTDGNGNTNTTPCSFDIEVEDDEKPSFDDPLVAIADLLDHEVSVSYRGANANYSGRLIIVLDCDSTNYQSDLLKAQGFIPAATDNCDPNPIVTQIFTQDNMENCGTIFGVTNIANHMRNFFSVVDSDGNMLDAPSEEFQVQILTQDKTPPDFNPSTSDANVPVTPATEDETTAGTAADPFLYSGGSITFNTNASFNTISARDACAIDFIGSASTTTNITALGVLPDDCQDLTFTSSVVGNGVNFSGATNDVADGMPQFDVGTYTITYTATDACNRVSQYSFTLEIVDNTPPSLDNCANTAASIDAGNPYTTNLNGCQARILYEAPMTVFDNCSPPGTAQPVLTVAILDINNNATTIVVDQNAGGTPLMHLVDLPIGKWKIQYTLTDGSSLTDMCTIPIEVINIESPTISCGMAQDINSICPKTKVPDYTTNAMITTCNPDSIVITQIPAANTNLEDISGLILMDSAQFTVTLIVTDTSTNLQNMCDFTVTLLDNDAPTPITSPLPSINASTSLEAECGSISIPAYTARNCDGTIVTGTTTDADSFIDTNNDGTPDIYIFNTDSHFVEWTYRDDNNNETTQTQIILIEEDTDKPIITITNTPINSNTSPGVCVRNINLANFLDEVFPTTAPFSDNTTNRQYIDNCGVVSLEYEVSGATSILRTDLDGISQLNPGSNILTFYATDAAGNVGSNTVEVIVRDNEAPVSTSPTAITLNMSDMNDSDPTDCAYTIANGSLVDPTATDNCGMTSPIRSLEMVTATLSDGGTFQAPTPVVLGSLEGFTFTVANNSTAVFTAEYKFDDGNGQTIPYFVTITVVDDRAPVITCPSSTTRDGNCDYQTVGTEFDVVASDNCTSNSDLIISNNINHGTSLAGETFQPGETTVTWTITDLNGETSTCEIVINIEDNLEPTLNCIDITRNLLSNGTVSVTAMDFLSSISDACTGVDPDDFNISIDQTSFSCLDPLNTPIQVEITVRDQAGNPAICRPTITIQETVAPTASCVSVVRDLSATAPGMVTVNASELNDGSTANCPTNTGDLVFSFTPNASNPMLSMDFDCDDTGINPVSFFAIDASGNVSEACSAMITINDNTNISIQCQDLTRTLSAAGSVTVDASEFNNGSSDNCGSTSTLSYNLLGIGSALTVGCDQVGDNDYVLEISDGNNTTTCDVTLTVLDQTGPVAGCQPVSVNLDGAGTQTINASMFNLNSLDECSGSTISFEFADGSSTMMVDCNDLGTNPITITVRDNVGNASTCNTFLTVGPASPAVFTAGTVSAGAGATVDIDITAENYFEMISWQFSGNIDPTFATINSITSPLPGSLFQTQIDVSTGEFRMGYSQFPSATLGNGVVVATINVTLISNVVGSSTTVNLKDGPLALEIAQGCSQAPQATDIDEATHLVDGQLNIANGQVTISGTIETDQEEGIPNVIVSVTGDVTLSTITDANGFYSVVIPSGNSVTVTPIKDTNHKNGISALDAALVQALVSSPMSTTLLPTPAQRIAADPNTNQDISGIDAAIIGRVSVLSGATFHNPPGYDVNSWVFVDGGHVFTDPLDPWNAPYDEALTYTNLTASQSGQDFTGIKIGNVIGSLDDISLLTENGDTRSSDLIFNIQDQAIEAGAVVSIPLKIQSFQDLIAFQTTLNFDATALTFNGITTDLLNQNGHVIMDVSQTEAGLLPLSWFSGQGVNLEDQNIAIVLNFTANASLESLDGLLSVSDDLISTAAWHSDLEAIGIDLKVEILTATNDPANGFELFQNKPNPFRTNTLISFNLPEATYGTLSIYDISGRLVYSSSENYNSGYNEVSIDRSELNNNGVFIYQFKTDKYAAIKKLTLLE